MMTHVASVRKPDSTTGANVSATLRRLRRTANPAQLSDRCVCGQLCRGFELPFAVRKLPCPLHPTFGVGDKMFVVLVASCAVDIAELVGQRGDTGEDETDGVFAAFVPAGEQIVDDRGRVLAAIGVVELHDGGAEPMGLFEPSRAVQRRSQVFNVRTRLVETALARDGAPVAGQHLVHRRIVEQIG